MVQVTVQQNLYIRAFRISQMCMGYLKMRQVILPAEQIGAKDG